MLPTSLFKCMSPLVEDCRQFRDVLLSLPVVFSVLFLLSSCGGSEADAPVAEDRSDVRKSATGPALHQGDQASRYAEGKDGQLDSRKLEIAE